MNKICVIGSLNMDVSCIVDQLPVKGQTILSKELLLNCGGKGANQAVACAKLGGDICMLGCVGDDDNGKILLDNLNKVGVDTSRIKIVGDSSGTAFINVDSNGDNMIVVYQGANKSCTPEYIMENIDIIKECQFILVQLEIPLETIYTIKKISKEYDIKLIINPAPIPQNAELNLFKDSYLLIPNESELFGIINKNNDIEESLKYILSNNVENIIVTLGERGSMLKNNNTCLEIPAYKVNAIDTVAAGDCFCGGLVVGLSNGLNFEESIKFASAAAAIAVTRKGAQASIPSKEEVVKFLENNGGLI